jgi:hypothetical protein
MNLGKLDSVIESTKQQFADSGLDLSADLVALIVKITAVAGGAISILINVFVGLKGLSAANGKTVGKASTIIAIIFAVVNAYSLITSFGLLGKDIVSGLITVLSAAAYTAIYVVYVLCMRALRKN